MTRKTAASLKEIAQSEGLSISAIRMILSSGLKKLRSQRLIITARELSIELQRHRNVEHTRAPHR